MDSTEIKTRHGLILQGVLAEALRGASYCFKENWQYDPTCERPDFTIPDTDRPDFAIEVHQTDVRDSFRMKILRSFNAVCEAKVHFGNKLISVNVLFGDPDREVPASNVRALFEFFDTNLVPRYDETHGPLIAEMEERALGYAADETVEDVKTAVPEVVKVLPAAVTALGDMMKATLDEAKPKVLLYTLWNMERARVAGLGEPPVPGEMTQYKKAILQSLFLSDDHFGQLLRTRDPNRVDAAVRQQLILTELAEADDAVREDFLVLNSALRRFVSDPRAADLRKLCEVRLDQNRAMHWFFEDVRDRERRRAMVDIFLGLLNRGPEALEEGFRECLEKGNYGGIHHARCWIADLMPLYAERSHNNFNKRMFQHPGYTQTIGNPFNNITIRAPRLCKKTDVLDELSEVAVSCFYEACSDAAVVIGSVTAETMQRRLLAFRRDAAIKLQKLNPLFLTVESVASELGLTATYGGTPSFLSDVSDPADEVGKYDVYSVSDGTREVMVNALFIGDTYGSDHKADEWSARRRSMGYRLVNRTTVATTKLGFVFVIDGSWEPKSILKLYNAGWTHICRLGELEGILRHLFGL